MLIINISGSIQLVDIREGNILFNVRISIRENNSIIILSTAIKHKNRLEIMIMIIPTAYSGWVLNLGIIHSLTI